MARLAGGWRDLFARSLRVRVLSLTLAAFVAVAVPAGFCFVWLVDTTVLRLGTLFAEKQILYDRYRGLEALTREVALAETLARSPVVQAWALNEDDAAKRARGIEELEHFRGAFADRSYFFVVDRSGNYYFNDRDGTYSGDQYRYTLSPDNPRDGWYYKTATAGAGCHLNVDHDDVLALTKVWINCVMEVEGRVLGILGTGIDLTVFIRNVVQTDQTGVESMFVDRFGAVQANRNEKLIDFHSLTKDAADKRTIFQLLDRPSDHAALAAMFEDVSSGRENAAARFVRIDGRSMLLGVGYLDRLGWFNVTVMDIDQIIDRRIFGPIAVLFALMMLAAAVLVTMLFKRNVLDRLDRAERSVRRVEEGDFTVTLDESRPDEIGRLSRALNRMARAVGSDRAMLEAAVRERTEQLERIAYLDPLSGVLNRRGFIEAFVQAQARARGHSGQIGLLILDIDRFKAINDSNGHVVGDGVIVEIARRLIDVTREEDICARWGGDEFVLVLERCTPHRLADVGGRILHRVRAEPLSLPGGGQLRMTTSIGAHLVEAGETMDSATARADAALYSAKRGGRNRMVVFDHALHAIEAEAGKVA